MTDAEDDALLWRMLGRQMPGMQTAKQIAYARMMARRNGENHEPAQHEE